MRNLGIAVLVACVAASFAGAADVPELVGRSSGGSTGVVPEAMAVLWDQPLSAVDDGAYANQDFAATNDSYDIAIADDFTAPDPWDIDTIFVNGNSWNPGNDLTLATALNWYIFGDASGVPDGHPWGGTAPIWSLSLPPGDSQVTLSAGTGSFLTNVTLNLTTPISLPAGTYWLVFVPSMEFATAGQYGRQPSDTANGYVAMVINPAGGFGFPTTWTPVTDASTWALTTFDFSFRLEGVVVPVELQSFSIE